ncbi:MAG: M23 family metallopeptidase, partial [Anaerolineae bacterium]|nr:M23 family metallopeptidase [Anaerolineae bacterium]
NANLIAGTRIVIPSGVKPFKARVVETASNNNSGNAGSYAYTAPAPAYSGATGNFLWPAAASYVSQGFWWGHRALDVAASVGVPIYASDSGCVSYAGWSNVGYGYMVLINHGNGFQTLYGHLSQYYIDAGQCVNRGAVIGAMGSTGNSTGPHLHFEIRVNGVPDNPYYYLQ